MKPSPRFARVFALTSLATQCLGFVACSSESSNPPPVTDGSQVSTAPGAGGNAAASGEGNDTARDGDLVGVGPSDSLETGAGTSTSSAAPAMGSSASGATNDGSSAAGSTSPVGTAGTGASNTGSGAFVSEDEAILVVEGMTETDGEDRPVNLGSETECDGLDENDNGVIDDVDVGRDGLCDCINMGFFGQISSDAGSDTAAFEAWLVERSGEVPVKHLDADGTITEEWLASLQVLIVGGLEDRSGGFSDAEIAAFDGWLQERGAGVITLNGYTNQIEDGQKINELLVNTGLGYDFGGGIPGQGVIGDGEAPPVWLSDLPTPDHPSVDGVNQIGVFYGYPVAGDGSVILRAEGFDLAMAKEIGKGRAFVFADEWITQDATWSGSVNGQDDPCQQPCNEEQNICGIAETQCARCEDEPCSDPAELDSATCTKGCQPSCDSETARCETYAAECAECTEASDARAEATPRLWLNTIRWLTPENECKVDIPPVVRVR